MKYVSPLVGLTVLWCLPLGAAEFQGADAVFKRLAEQRAKTIEAPKPTDPVAELRDKLKAYRAGVAALTPEQAAEQWLALFDAYTSLPREELNSFRSGGTNFTVQSFLAKLPPSADWDALAKAIGERGGSGHEVRDSTLRVLAATLRGDDEGRKKAFAALRKAVDGGELQDCEKEPASPVERTGQYLEYVCPPTVRPANK